MGWAKAAIEGLFNPRRATEVTVTTPPSVKSDAILACEVRDWRMNQEDRAVSFCARLSAGEFATSAVAGSSAGSEGATTVE